LRQASAEETEGVAAHDAGDLVVGEALGKERVGDLDEAGGVEGSGDGAVEVRAEGDLVGAAKWRALRSARVSMLKKSLTPPTLSEMAI
jgi:hypothetical protein